MSRKILIADDEPFVMCLIETMLQSEGFAVTKAVDGNEALVKAESEKPDLILLDVMMPNLDGWKTLEKLKRSEQTSKIPVIMLTGSTSMESRERALENGAIEYIHKPFSPREIMNCIKIVLR